MGFLFSVIGYFAYTIYVMGIRNEEKEIIREFKSFMKSILLFVVVVNIIYWIIYFFL